MGPASGAQPTVHGKDGRYAFSAQVCAVVTRVVRLPGVISWLESREECLHKAALGGMHLKAERL